MFLHSREMFNSSLRIGYSLNDDILFVMLLQTPISLEYYIYQPHL